MHVRFVLLHPLLSLALTVGLAGCGGPAADPGPSADIPASSAREAEACAAKLPAAAGVIYRDAAPDVHAETNMESLLRVKVMMLIVRDQVRRAEARPAAEAAVECLEILQR